MAINPSDISTVRVGQLPTAIFSLTDVMPHEVGTTLSQGTIQDLSNLIAGQIGTSDSLAFNPMTVTNGGTLPDTSSNEWMLVGKGTFHNVSGSPDIITTEELNAVTSNGTYWSLSVEIPINVELAGIVQTIREGETDTTPSEDAVFQALALKSNITDIAGELQMIDYDITSDGVDSFFIPTGTTAKQVFLDKQLLFKSTTNNTGRTDLWTQTGDVVTLTTPTEINNYIQIFYQ